MPNRFQSSSSSTGQSGSACLSLCDEVLAVSARGDRIAALRGFLCVQAFVIIVVCVWTAGELSVLESGVWILSFVTILSALVMSAPGRASRHSRRLSDPFVLGVVVFPEAEILSLFGLTESLGPVALASMLMSVVTASALGRVDAGNRDSQWGMSETLLRTRGPSARIGSTRPTKLDRTTAATTRHRKEVLSVPPSCAHASASDLP